MISQDSHLTLLEKYQKALGHAHMGLWEIDFSTNLIKWDEGIRQLYDVNESIFEGYLENWLYKIHPEDRRRLKVELENSQKDLSEIDSLFRYNTSSGKIKYIRTNAIKIRGDQNQVVGLVGLNWDVTQEYELRESLSKTKIFLEKVVEAIPDPVFIKDRQRRYYFANKAFENLVGRPQKDFLGKTDHEFLPQSVAESCYHLDVEAFEQNTAVEKEETIQSGPTTVQQILTKKSVFKINDSEVYLVGVVRDITEIKNIQHSLVEQSKMASLGEMAAGIAHEINNPLMIIQVKSQILQEGLNGPDRNLDSVRLAKDLQSIENNSLRINRIIQSLKSVSRQSDQDPYEDISIRKIIDDAVELSRERFNFNEISLHVIFDQLIDHSYKVKARNSEIVQVLVNLLNNSFDAVKNQKNSWVKINLALLDSTFRIEVIDSGPAISKQVAEKMMDPFFTTKSMGAGTGLGLSVSRQIIKNHNGLLYYDRKSANTKFVFHLKRSESIAVANSARAVLF